MKITFFIALLSINLAFAQQPKSLNSENRKAKIESAKIGMITNRLNLTPEQSTQFWAVYNDFDNRRRDNRKLIRRLVDEASSTTTTDDKILSAHREILSIKEKEVDLEKEYFGKFLKAINIRQYAELHKAERDFNQLLLNKLQQEGKNNDD